MKIIVQIARVLTGLLFIFSGMVKLNDPSGFSIKLNEYMDVFAQDVSVSQDTLKISLFEGNKDLGTKSFVLYSFDAQRDLNINSKIDTSQTVTYTTKIVKKDTQHIPHVKIAYAVSLSANLGKEEAAKARFDLADSFAVSMVSAKAEVAGKNIFLKNYKISATGLITEKTTLNLKEYVKQESWLNGFFKLMKNYTLWLSIFICALEVILGFALIVGWSINFTSWIMLLLIVFFTFLTGYSWLSGYAPTRFFWGLMISALVILLIAGLVKKPKIRNYILIFWLLFVGIALLACKYTSMCFQSSFDKLKMKVTDCGCFGDFLHLQPKESFFKDLILLILILIIFFGRQYIKPWFSKKFGWKFIAFITLLSAGFGIYCYFYLPVWDFLPYKKGNNIKEIMTTVPVGMRANDSINMSYMMNKGNDSVLVPIPPYDEYSKKVKEGWKAGRRIEKMVIEGYHSPIHDFVITDAKSGMEMRDTFLNYAGHQLMWVVPYTDNSYQGANGDIIEIYNWSKNKKMPFWPMASSGQDVITAYEKQNKFAFNFYISDQKTLLTIARYSPTLYLFKGPVVVRKWSGRNMPSLSRLEKLISK